MTLLQTVLVDTMQYGSSVDLRHNVRPELVVSAELHEEPDSPQVVRLIIVHSSLVHNVLL